MKAPLRRNENTTAKEIAYIAVMTALLIGGQLVFSFVMGVEVVTLLLVCFSYVFGVKDGVLTAVAFSLLRCFLWGFYPTVIILYLVYYPLLAAAFGAIGHVKEEFFEAPRIWFLLALNLVLAAIITACALCLGLNLIKISRLYKATLNTFLWVITALCLGLALAFNCVFILKRCGVIKRGEIFKTLSCTIIAAVFTICFTLLDDVISPLITGMTQQAALTYFYASFTAMLPQTVCTIVSVFTMFLPVTKTFERAKKL